MNLFKLLFQFNPSKLQLIPAERLTRKMRDQIANFLDSVSEQITNKNLDVTPSQLQYLKNQGDEIAKYDAVSATKGIKSLGKPEAEIIAPLDFGKAPKTDLKKVRARVDSDKKTIQDLADNDQIKVIDQFRDENTLQNLYKTRDEAIAKGDNKAALKISEDIFAIENKKPLSDFADGGRVAMNIGGLAKIKKLLDLLRKTKSKLGEAPKTNLKKVREQKKAFDEREKELAKSGQIPVKDQTTKSNYKFTGRETEDDLYDLEEKGIITRADHNVYSPRYLEWLDARVKYYYGYTKGQMNKIKNQPARLDYLRAQVSPRWGEANFGEDYVRVLEKARGKEINAMNPGQVDKSGPFDHIFEKMYKPVQDDIQKAKDKIPGEDALPIEKKRTLHAEGGLATLFVERG